MANEKEIKDEAIKRITRELMDSGQIIGGGWAAFKLMTIPPTASRQQVDDLRIAFYAGAQHLWGSVISTLDPGLEETPDDLRRMDLIHKELEEFVKELSKKVAK